MEQVTYSINGFDIILPIGLQQVLNTPVRDSYQDFLQKDTSLVRRHLTSLTTLLPKHLGEVRNVLHVFGGVGATAQVIDQCVDNTVHHTFWERDPVLVEYLREHFPRADVYHYADSYEQLLLTDDYYLRGFDHIMFDPSVSTIKTPKIKECWAKMAKVEPDLIWLSDTACAKIHLNYKTYEKDFGLPVEKTAEGYLEAYDRWLRAFHNLSIVDAMREAAETYCVIKPGILESFPRPIPYV